MTVKDVYYGKTLRKSFARYQEILEMPNLLEIQKKSYQEFLDTGLREVFNDVGAITDYQGNLELQRYLKGLGLDVTYEEGPGRHDMAFWDEYIERVIEWLPLTGGFVD